MYSRLVIEGNAVYEIDEECASQRQRRKNYGGEGQNNGSVRLAGAGDRGQ